MTLISCQITIINSKKMTFLFHNHKVVKDIFETGKGNTILKSKQNNIKSNMRSSNAEAHCNYFEINILGEPEGHDAPEPIIRLLT